MSDRIEMLQDVLEGFKSEGFNAKAIQCDLAEENKSRAWPIE